MKVSDRAYFYFAANLAILIPIPGRFAYALVLLLLFNIQMAVISLMYGLVYKMNLYPLRNVIIAFVAFFITILYKQLLIIYCPIMALTLGFCLYLPTLSSATIEFFFAKKSDGLKQLFADNMTKSGIITLYSLVYFLLRDVMGYGTFTLPFYKYIKIYTISDNMDSVSTSLFFATIPGSLVLIAFLLSLLLFIKKKSGIIERLPKNWFEE